MKTTSFGGVIRGFKAKPTQKHRPALWEVMLGTVAARNKDGIDKNFDYDYEAAIVWAGLDVVGVDIRVYKVTRDRYFQDTPRGVGKTIVWIKDRTEPV